MELVLIIILIALYFLPFVFACIRGHEQSVWIFVVNLLVGWTIIGWLIMVGYACLSNPHSAGKPSDQGFE